MFSDICKIQGCSSLTTSYFVPTLKNFPIKFRNLFKAYLFTVILSEFCENTNHTFPNLTKYLYGMTFQLTNWLLIITNKSIYPRCFKRHKVTLNIDHFKTPIFKFPTTVFRFILSGLLLQINLKHLLSISFLYFSGTTQALATYVNIGTINDLIIQLNCWYCKLTHLKPNQTEHVYLEHIDIIIKILSKSYLFSPQLI